MSQQRIQLQYDYYQEKKLLKLKAIENILIKCQQGRQGFVNEETKQMMALLDDIKTIKTPKLPQVSQSLNKSKASFQMSPDNKKAIQVLEKFPKNLFATENQDRLLDVMNSTFGISQAEIAELTKEKKV